jgi:hypothetical protein
VIDGRRRCFRASGRYSISQSSAWTDMGSVFPQTTDRISGQRPGIPAGVLRLFEV